MSETKTTKLNKYRITAALTVHDGVRSEDLGVHEAAVGHKAKAKAIALHAGRMGWRQGRRGPNTGKWVFSISLADKPVNPPTPPDDPTPVDEQADDAWPTLVEPSDLANDTIDGIEVVEFIDPDAGLNEEALYFAETALSRVLHRLRSHTLRGQQLERMKLIEKAVNYVNASRLA